MKALLSAIVTVALDSAKGIFGVLRRRPWHYIVIYLLMVALVIVDGALDIPVAAALLLVTMDALTGVATGWVRSLVTRLAFRRSARPVREGDG